MFSWLFPILGYLAQKKIRKSLRKGRKQQELEDEANRIDDEERQREREKDVYSL